MTGRRFTLFKLFGFEVKAEWSWLILAVLITWSLASNIFPNDYAGLSGPTYWWMGAAGALGLFGSVVFHELSHSLIARRYGLPIAGITLFIFGGVAEMEDEPPSAQSEFVVALAGPVSSVLLALAFYGLSQLGGGIDWPAAAVGVLSYLASINVSLAAFNILPAFPLDGGRVLRSILWGWKDDLRWATRIASRIGSAFGVLLIVGGVVQLFLGNFVGGLWLFVIGSYLQSTSRSSYLRLFVSEAFQGETVRRFMKPDPVTVGPSLSVRQLVQEYIYRYHYKMYPVVEGSALVGCVTSRAVQGIPTEEWDRRTVGDLLSECSMQNTIGSTADAMDALSRMSSTKNSRLMVVDEGQLVGVITLKDMLEFLSLKMNLEGRR